MVEIQTSADTTDWQTKSSCDVMKLAAKPLVVYDPINRLHYQSFLSCSILLTSIKTTGRFNDWYKTWNQWPGLVYYHRDTDRSFYQGLFVVMLFYVWLDNFNIYNIIHTTTTHAQLTINACVFSIVEDRWNVQESMQGFFRSCEARSQRLLCSFSGSKEYALGTSCQCLRIKWHLYIILKNLFSTD